MLCPRQLAESLQVGSLAICGNIQDFERTNVSLRCYHLAFLGSESFTAHAGTVYSQRLGRGFQTAPLLYARPAIARRLHDAG
jgi:hypothetical protein